MPIKAIFCLPDYGFDPTEAAVPFELFHNAGWELFVATEHGSVAACDSRMMKGLLSKLAGAKAPAKKAYGLMVNSSSFKTPLSWTSNDFTLLAYDVLILPGGHDKGVKQIIESKYLKPHLVKFFPLTLGVAPKKVCGAICHGVMVLAWTKDEEDKSLLYERRTTTLPLHLEKMAYYSTAFALGNYYRTYPGTYTAEAVQKCLKNPAQYEPGPWNLSTSYDESAAHVVTDDGYISARWPGDALEWSRTILKAADKLEQ
ncbi:class I glutamine amidotransferase-like protein [Ramaria rubella]|nr:class I glutamine amidotransferase-like protein [Ramaria rubella]